MKRTIDYSLKRDQYLTDICRYLSCSDEEVIKGVNNLNNRLETTIGNNKRLEDEIVRYEINDMIENSIKINGIL